MKNRKKNVFNGLGSHFTPLEMPIVLLILVDLFYCSVGQGRWGFPVFSSCNHHVRPPGPARASIQRPGRQGYVDPLRRIHALSQPRHGPIAACSMSNTPCIGDRAVPQSPNRQADDERQYLSPTSCLNSPRGQGVAHFLGVCIVPRPAMP